jgi:hypothetical protein
MQSEVATRTRTGQPVAEAIAESGVQSDTPERKETALVARYKASRSEKAFLPAMSMEVAHAVRKMIEFRC